MNTKTNPKTEIPPSGIDEQTRVDLGEDLLAPPAAAASELEGEYADGDVASAGGGPNQTGPNKTGTDQVEDLLSGAEILVNEGLWEDAKRRVRAVLVVERDNLRAWNLLNRIHEQELKQIFAASEVATEGAAIRVEAPMPVPEVDALIARLDRDLGLGLEADLLPEFMRDEASRKVYAERVAADTAGLAPTDRVDLGVSFLEMGLPEVASKLFRLARRDALEGTRPDGAFARGAAWLVACAELAAGRGFEAICVIEEALSDSELSAADRPHFLYLMGRAHEMLRQYGDAAVWYRKTIEADPGYRDTRERLKTLA